MGEESEHWRLDEIGLGFSQNWRRIREEREDDYVIPYVCIYVDMCVLCMYISPIGAEHPIYRRLCI